MFGIPEQHIENLIANGSKAALYPYDSLIEECGELITAVAKFTSSGMWYSPYGPVPTTVKLVDHILEEMTHVLITANLVARKLGISMDDIKTEVLRKAESGNFDTTNYVW